MERNTKTLIKELQIGDRFYKCRDKNKIVFEKVYEPFKRTNYRTYANFAKTDVQLRGVPMNGDTEVIFLRHNEN